MMMRFDPADEEPVTLGRILREVPEYWFDFIGAKNEKICWGWYMVVSFDQRTFDVKGGEYF